MRAFVERKQLEMALGPGIVCQQFPKRTVVPCWRPRQKWRGHVTHMKDTGMSHSRKGSDGHYKSLSCQHSVYAISADIGWLLCQFLVIIVFVRFKNLSCSIALNVPESNKPQTTSRKERIEILHHCKVYFPLAHSKSNFFAGFSLWASILHNMRLSPSLSGLSWCCLANSLSLPQMWFWLFMIPTFGMSVQVPLVWD